MGLALDPSEITAVVRRLVGVDDLVVTESTIEPLGWLKIMDAELSRATGTAITAVNGTPIDWSFVLKEFEPPAADSSAALPGSWDYWKREVVAYESGAVEGLPGALASPRFLGSLPQPNGTVLLAIEEIDTLQDRWDVGRFHRAARVMGSFNAGYLDARRLPDAPAFAAGGLRSWANGLATFADENPGIWNAPLLTRAIPEPAEVHSMFDGRLEFFDALDAIPQTFVHRDLWPANLLVRRFGGEEQFVAIDWMLAGAGALGEDVAGMVGATLWHFLIEPEQAGVLESAVVDGYLAGLRDGGWTGDDKLVRFGSAAALAVRFGLLIPPWLGAWLASDAERQWAEEKFGRSIDAIADGWGQLQRWLMSRAAYARTLAGPLGLS